MGDATAESITEREIYILTNFRVKKYIGHETYMTVKLDKHIYFTEHKKCEKDSALGLPIDLYAFDLFALEEIPKNAYDNRFLIGILQCYLLQSIY